MHCNSIINTAFCLTLIFAISCGQSDEEKIEQAMKQMQADRQKRTAVLASAADNLDSTRNNTQRANGNGAAPPSLGYRELKSLLPENVSGMKRDNADAGNEQGILLTITDLGSLKGMTSMAEYRWAADDVDRATESGYEKSIIYKGYRGLEKYDHVTRNGEIQILVAGRFVVQAQGFKMDMEEIKSALNDVELEKIANKK